MIKTLWFMLKVGLFVALAIWVSQQQGRVEIEWLDYTINVHVGLFLAGLLTLILISIFVFSTIKTFVDFPKSLRRYNEIKRFEKGYKALTLGLSAVAAGDGKIARYQSHRAEKLLEGDNGLPLLLKAQAARMHGDEDTAHEAFVGLLENKDAAFLGVRGLLQSSLDAGEFQAAADTAYKALELQPKQPWLIKTIYDLEIQLQHWDAARLLQPRAQKYNALSKEEVRADQVAMLHIEAEEAPSPGEAQKKYKAAYSLDKGFVPSVVALAKSHYSSGQRRKAVKMVEKAWQKTPHPDLARIWESLISQDLAKKPLGRMQWAERLVKLSLNSYESQIFAARVAAAEKLWGEARRYFQRAEELLRAGDGDARLYYLWSDLEERAGGGKRVIAQLLEKAQNADAAKAWVCGKTGQVYEAWQPVAAPYGAFNTIQWAQPKQQDMVERIGRFMPSGGVLDAPRKVG